MDDVAVTEAMAHCDSWIAAVLGTQEAIKNPRPAAKSNLIGGLNILEAANNTISLALILLWASWMNNTYSITKTMIERFIDMYNRNRGTKVNIVRVVNAYGPRQLAAEPYGCGKVRKITPAFACRALLGQPIEVYGDGKQVSDMVYVGDVAKALVKATEKAVAGVVFPHPVEVGPSENMSVGEIAQLINEIAGGKSEIVNLPMRPGENVGDRVTADNSTLALVEMDPQDLVLSEKVWRRQLHTLISI